MVTEFPLLLESCSVNEGLGADTWAAARTLPPQTMVSGGTRYNLRPERLRDIPPRADAERS